VSSAAIPTATLNVDPGGYDERYARGKSGMSGSDCNALSWSAEMDGTNTFGSYVGQDASARTSPLFGSIITMAPRFAFDASAFSASSWRCKSRVVTTLYPGSGGVISFSDVFRSSLSNVSLYS